MKLPYTLSKIKAHPNNWITTIIFKVLLKFFMWYILLYVTLYINSAMIVTPKRGLTFQISSAFVHSLLPIESTHYITVVLIV